MDTREIGTEAEQYACQFLENKGLKLLARNYRCLFGEIDLIMRDGNDVVFVEVRKRMHADYGSAIESVTLTKQRKIIKTAMHYLQKLHWFDKVHSRFDIIGISHDEFEWVKDAFSAGGF